MHLSETSKNHAPNLVVARQSLVRTLESRILAESLRNSATQKNWTIIGSGSIGEKAQDLLVKTPAILEAGFLMNERVVLAMGFFEAFYARNGITGAQDYNERHKRIMNASFSVQELETLAKFPSDSGENPSRFAPRHTGMQKGQGSMKACSLRIQRAERRMPSLLGKG